MACNGQHDWVIEHYVTMSFGDSRFDWDPRRRKLKIWPGNLSSQRRLPCRQVNPKPADRISASKIQAIQILAVREDMKTLKTNEHLACYLFQPFCTGLTISISFSAFFFNSGKQAASLGALGSLTVTTVSSQYLRFSACSCAPCRFWTALTSWRKRPPCCHPEMCHNLFNIFSAPSVLHDFQHWEGCRLPTCRSRNVKG